MEANRVHVVHRTSYYYRSPVSLGKHEMRLRPRETDTVKILESHLSITNNPSIGRTRDRYGNIVEYASFDKRESEQFDFVSDFTVLHAPRSRDDIARAVRDATTSPDTPRVPARLGRACLRESEDAGRVIDHWSAMVAEEARGGTALDLMCAINTRIRHELCYGFRGDVGTQEPLATLESGTGTCRDYAALLMEAARSLGFPSIFVSGYIYESDTGDEVRLVGGYNTHAWARVYLPGAGWVDFDPTNESFSDQNLIASSLTVSPKEATTIINGTFWANMTNAFSHMDVDVTIQSCRLHTQTAKEETKSPVFA